MRRWALGAVIAGAVAGCAGPPPLSPDLDGDWVILLDVREPQEERAAEATFVWDEALETLDGEIVIEEPDETRTYTLTGSTDVEQLGIALRFVEAGGVRRLFAEISPPAEGDVIGGWRTQYACADRLVELCGEEGILSMDRP